MINLQAIFPKTMDLSTLHVSLAFNCTQLVFLTFSFKVSIYAPTYESADDMECRVTILC